MTDISSAQLLDQWGKSLKNRNADDDRSRTKRQLVPRFGKLTLEQITLPVVMTWIDELGESGLSPQTQRHALNTLSRFFSWCIERGLATINPVRMVPVGKRPTPPIDRDQPWLEDETKVPELVAALGADLGLAFYLANRSGMRLGEVVGLRMGDLDFLADGVIRVAHSYGGPLKEDRTGEGKVKWVPAPSDAEEMLKLHLARRRLNGAKAEDLVFMPPSGGRRRKLSWAGYRKESVEAEWDRASAAVGVTMSWYQATRHTAVSRALKAGVPLDQVSAAVGHASPEPRAGATRTTCARTSRQGSGSQCPRARRASAVDSAGAAHGPSGEEPGGGRVGTGGDRFCRPRDRGAYFRALRRISWRASFPY